MNKKMIFYISLWLFLIPVNAVLRAQECIGTSNEVSQADPLTYRWTFQTTAANEGEFTFGCVDEKVGLVAFFWDQTNGFTETQMSNIPGTQDFTYKTAPMEEGSTINFSCKFAYAGGMSVTKQFRFTIGSCKDGEGPEDTEAPENFIATLKKVSSTQAVIEVKAEDNSGYITYTISRDGDTDITFTGASGAVTEKTITGLVPATSYVFSVSAKDASGNVAENSPVSLTVTTPENQGTGCTGTSDEISQDNPLTYSWEFKTTPANEAEITFECLETKDGLVAFFWDQTDGFMEMPMTNIPGTSKFVYKTKSLDTGKTIKFSCKFAYAGGQSVTRQFEFTLGDCKDGGDTEDTEAPTNFTARINNVSYGEVTVEVNAEDNSGHIIYTVERDGADNTVFSAASGVVSRQTIGDLNPGTEYTLRIHAKDASGNEASNNPEILSFTTLTAENTECEGIGYSYENNPSIKPIFHYHISTTADMMVKIDLEFEQAVTGLEAQILALWPEGGDSIIICTTNGENKYTATIPYNVAGDPFTAGQTATFKGRFPYAGGLALTTPFTYTAGNNCNGTGIFETDMEKGNLYMSSGLSGQTITVTNSTGIREWELYTAQGKLIMKKRNNGNTINLPAGYLKAGIYLLVIQDNNGKPGHLKIRR